MMTNMTWIDNKLLQNGSIWGPIETWLKYKSVSYLLGTWLDTLFKIGPLSQKLQWMAISFLPSFYKKLQTESQKKQIDKKGDQV